MDSKPWEVHPALTEDRLVCLAGIIRGIRHKAVELHQPEEGDGAWSLGCRIYERTINAIEKESKNLQWLEAKKNNLYFLMLIGGVPVRFHSGDVENPHSRFIKRLPLEIQAGQQFAFPFDTSSWFWRLIVEPDENKQVMRIVIVQYTESGNYRNLWEIPVSEPVSPITSVEYLPQDGVVLGEPYVAPKYDRTEKAAGNEKDK